MDAPKYYRGGPSLKPRPSDYRIDRGTGLVKTVRGVFVRDQPDGFDRFGGAYEVGSLPDNLHVNQIGKDPHHFEIAPAVPMTPAEFGTFIQSELERYTVLARERKIVID